MTWLDDFREGFATMPVLSARTWIGYRIELGGADERRYLLQRWAVKTVQRYARAETLEVFLQLANAPDESVFRFASKYGLLNLCKHGEPLGRCREVLRERGIAGDVELVDHWRRWAVRLRATVQIGAAIRSGQRPSPLLVGELLDDLRHVDAGTIREALLRPTERDEAAPPHLWQRARAWWFCSFVNQYLTFQAVISPAKNNHLAMEYGPGNLFATLMLQAALAATGTPALIICANCRRPYRPQRRPTPNRNSYCESRECRVLAAQRDASRRYRQTQQALRTSQARGQRSRNQPRKKR